VAPEQVIEKNIHFVWIGGDMPEWAKCNINEFRRLNPDYHVMIHGEEALLPSLVPVYQKLTDIRQKSDLLRLSVLKTFGGWYFDTDFWPLRSCDDAERSFGVDGSRLFLSKQQGNRNPRLDIANAPMAAAKDSPVIDELVKAALVTENISGTAYGPALVKSFVAKNAHKCHVIGGQWYFPANHQTAITHYQRILAGYDSFVYQMCEGTGGQKPFAIHLWAAGATDLLPKKNPYFVDRKGVDGGTLAGIVVNPIQQGLMAENPNHPLSCAIQGLTNLGYGIEVVGQETAWPCFTRKPALVVVWNGMREPMNKVVAAAVKDGVKVFRIENGFYDRKNYCQCDPEGILHWSGFARRIKEPAAMYQSRFEAIWKKPIIAIGKNSDRNTILVLGQTNGDTQLFDSEIKHPVEIERAVAKAVKGLDLHGRTVEFRPHPLDKRFVRNPLTKRYLPASRHASLEEALLSAAFVITINSNAGVEALAHGCPVLCFGPATYAMAGVAKRTTMDTLRRDIVAMLNGWRPSQDDVNNYLYQLAGNQYSLDEFRSGEAFKKHIA
jgi:hypothetical protein